MTAVVQNPTPSGKAAVRRRRTTRWALGLGIPAVLIVGTAAIWNWDWFIPMVEPRISAALGRRVTLAHLHVHLGWRTKIVADDVEIGNPAGFPAAAPFARLAHLGISVNVVDYVLHQQVDIPLIDLDHPVVNVAALPSGQDNYGFHFASGGAGPAPKIGRLTIEGGQAHVALAKLKADFQLGVHTTPAEGGGGTERPEGGDRGRRARHLRRSAGHRHLARRQPAVAAGHAAAVSGGVATGQRRHPRGRCRHLAGRAGIRGRQPAPGPVGGRTWPTCIR